MSSHSTGCGGSAPAPTPRGPPALRGSAVPSSWQFAFTLLPLRSCPCRGPLSSVLPAQCLRSPPCVPLRPRSLHSPSDFVRRSDFTRTSNPRRFPATLCLPFSSSFAHSSWVGTCILQGSVQIILPWTRIPYWEETAFEPSAAW